MTRVIDGDTIEIEGGLKMRYIGIDTPETVHPSKLIECYGQEASARNKQLVEGKVVELEKDVSETDRYDRLLRYIYVDGQMVNELLVRGGYAQVSTYPPDVKYVDLLLAAQQEAQDANRGLWGACVAEPSSTEEAAPQGGGFTVPPWAATDCDCKDFTSHAHAQWFYENYDPGNHHDWTGTMMGSRVSHCRERLAFPEALPVLPTDTKSAWCTVRRPIFVERPPPCLRNNDGG